MKKNFYFVTATYLANQSVVFKIVYNFDEFDFEAFDNFIKNAAFDQIKKYINPLAIVQHITYNPSLVHQS